jgi:hypothetical protein
MQMFEMGYGDLEWLAFQVLHFRPGLSVGGARIGSRVWKVCKRLVVSGGV